MVHGGHPDKLEWVVDESSCFIISPRVPAISQDCWGSIHLDQRSMQAQPKPGDIQREQLVVLIGVLSMMAASSGFVLYP